METELKITISQLEYLLNQQKRIVIENLSGQSGYYNEESTDGCYKTMPINKDKFEKLGMKSRYPDEIDILKKYVH